METAPNIVTIKLSSCTLTLKELSLRRYSLLAKILEEITASGQVMAKLESENIGEMSAGVAALMGIIPEKITAIIKLAAPEAEEDAILDLTPAEAVRVLLEIWKQNNLMDLFKKKLAPMLAQARGGTGKEPLTDA